MFRNFVELLEKVDETPTTDEATVEGNGVAVHSSFRVDREDNRHHAVGAKPQHPASSIDPESFRDATISVSSSDHAQQQQQFLTSATTATIRDDDDEQRRRRNNTLPTAATVAGPIPFHALQAAATAPDSDSQGQRTDLFSNPLQQRNDVELGTQGDPSTGLGGVDSGVKGSSRNTPPGGDVTGLVYRCAAAESQTAVSELQKQQLQRQLNSLQHSWAKRGELLREEIAPLLQTLLETLDATHTRHYHSRKSNHNDGNENDDDRLLSTHRSAMERLLFQIDAEAGTSDVQPNNANPSGSKGGGVVGLSAQDSLRQLERTIESHQKTLESLEGSNVLLRAQLLEDETKRLTELEDLRVALSTAESTAVKVPQLMKELEKRREELAQVHERMVSLRSEIARSERDRELVEKQMAGLTAMLQLRNDEIADARATSSMSYGHANRISATQLFRWLGTKGLPGTVVQEFSIIVEKVVMFVAKVLRWSPWVRLLALFYVVSLQLYSFHLTSWLAHELPHAGDSAHDHINNHFVK